MCCARARFVKYKLAALRTEARPRNLLGQGAYRLRTSFGDACVLSAPILRVVSVYMRSANRAERVLAVR